VKLDDKKFDEIFSEDDEKKRFGKKKKSAKSADDAPSSDVKEDDKITIELNNSVVASTVFDWLGSLFTALVCVLLVMTFFFRVIYVDGTSMEPTLIDTDKVIITDLFYTPHNGDVIVISNGEEYDKPLVKRVIAVPGQDLRIDFNTGDVYIDGKKLDEPYIQGTTIQGDRSAEDVNGIIPEGKLFVMGDNRIVSLDSRYRSVDLIDIDCVIGKTQFVVIPHSYGDDGIPKLDLGRMRYIYQ